MKLKRDNIQIGSAAIAITTSVITLISSIASSNLDFKFLPEFSAAIAVSFLTVYLSYSYISRKSNIKVFFSYSSEDKEFLGKISKDLESSGIEISAPEDFTEIGDSFESGIKEAIDSSVAIIVLISNSSSINKGMLHEIEIARGLGKVIMPILTSNDLSQNDLPEYFRGIKSINLGQEYEPGIKKIIKSIFKNSKQGSKIHA